MEPLHFRGIVGGASVLATENGLVKVTLTGVAYPEGALSVAPGVAAAMAAGLRAAAIAARRQFKVGDDVSEFDYQELPVGTVVGNDNRRGVALKVDEGTWLFTGDEEEHASTSLASERTILSLPQA